MSAGFRPTRSRRAYLAQPRNQRGTGLLKISYLQFPNAKAPWSSKGFCNSGSTGRRAPRAPARTSGGEASERTPRCQGRAGLGGSADLGWGGGLQVAGSSPGSTKHPSRKAQEPELSGLGRSAARDGSCPRSGGGGRRRTARRPGAGGAQVQVPCVDPGVGAAVTLVCLPSRGRRAPPGEGSVFALQGPSPLP